MKSIAYDNGYQDAKDGIAAKFSSYLGTRIEYLSGYRQQLLDHAEATLRDIEQATSELSAIEASIRSRDNGKI
jgi:hypothetical protein